MEAEILLSIRMLVFALKDMIGHLIGSMRSVMNVLGLGTK